MKKTLLLPVIMMGVLNCPISLVNAKSKIFSSQKLEEARAEGLISLKTLMVKVKNISQFKRDYPTLGSWESFFATKEGTWGMVKVPWILNGQSANATLWDLDLDSNIVDAYFAPIPRPASIESPSYEQKQSISYNFEAPTEDFESRQVYLKSSPEGVDAFKAWELPGGTGKNVKVVDVEVCYETNHEDFATPFYVGANPKCSDTNHGTAVWGEIAAKRDAKGVTGIAHEVQYGVYGFIEGEWEDVNEQYIKSINTAIQGSMDHLDAGDVLVIEQQMVGPDLKKYTAVEYWPHIFDQLKAATDKGIHCLEAAGNGDSNFDNFSYQGAFNISLRDSGCVMVGAVGSSKRRLYFSNYGSRVDVAGYGESVTTTGYGDLFNASNTRSYTSRFSGTSSATPIVSGVVAVVSSVAKEKGKIISPKDMRDALRATGVAQNVDAGQAIKRVGNFPSILGLLKKLELE